ncbi:MAG: transcriptional regulator [Clostridiales bacterium]|jgi:DNA-binding MarR family transcriptional regulator|nr:transcriptional regulator [Clostridiales bacterium]
MSGIEEIVDALVELMSSGRATEKFNRSGRGELFILKYLFKRNGPALPSELSEALPSSASRISAALGTLEKKGQIHREIDTSNRRNILVTITDAGRERILANMRQMRSHLIQALTEMGETDAREFLRLVTIFSEIVRRGELNMADCEDCSPDRPPPE